jgi:hypothetical protein
METKWAIILLAALLAALAQQCESNESHCCGDAAIAEFERLEMSLQDVFVLELYRITSNTLRQRLLNVLMKLGVEEKTRPDELAAKIQEAAEAQAGNEHADYRDIFQPLSSAIQNHENEGCPDKLINLLEVFLGLRIKQRDLAITPVNQFLKEKILPKLKKCVSRIEHTYAARKEMDVLEPLEGFFAAAFGPDWPAKLPEFRLRLDDKKIDSKLNVVSTMKFIRKVKFARSDGRRHPAYKMKQFLDDKCERIWAFRNDVRVIELVNAIQYEKFPDGNPPPEAQSFLPEKLLKIKNYYRICTEWRSALTPEIERFTKYIAHKYDLQQWRCSAIIRDLWKAYERAQDERAQRQRDRHARMAVGRY